MMVHYYMDLKQFENQVYLQTSSNKVNTLSNTNRIPTAVAFVVTSDKTLSPDDNVVLPYVTFS